MAILTVNTVPVIHAVITMPIVGAWVGLFEIDTTDLQPKALTVATDDGNLKLTGSVLRQDIDRGGLKLYAVGGMGGLSTLLDAKAYQGIDARFIASDTLRSAGETLSSTSDATLLGKVLKSWVRTRGSAASAIVRLCEAIGCRYRVLPDGTTWLGNDTYPAAPVIPFDVLNREPRDGYAILSSEQLFIVPGTSLYLPQDNVTRSVDHVVHTIAAATVTSEVWWTGVQS